MTQESDLLDRAMEYHRKLPERIRRYLNGRGIPDEIIAGHLLGWSGWRITIPIYNRTGEIEFFKLAKDPEDPAETPKMYATPGARAQLYGWDRVLQNPDTIIVCEGEFDRLVLEARGFAAVTSTGGAGTFLAEWAEPLRSLTNAYICFDHDEAGRLGAQRVARLLPAARVIQLPDEVGEGGDVTDFFVRLGRTEEDFRALMAAAQPLPPVQEGAEPVRSKSDSAVNGSAEAQQIKRQFPIETFIAKYLPLRRSGANFVANCPFHEDRNPSFVVFPRTQTFYCFGCREHGDVLTFLMRMEHLSFPEALKVFQQLSL